MRGDDSGQMRRTTCTGDDDAQPTRCRIARELSGRVRCSMRGENARLVRHAQLMERLDGMTHCVPIGFAAHDHSN